MKIFVERNQEMKTLLKYWLMQVSLRSVVFYCRIFSYKIIEVDPKKTNVVKCWPKPLSPFNIQSLLGSAGYFSRFIEGFSLFSSTLTILTIKKIMLLWSEAYEKTFLELKNRPTSPPMFTLREGSCGFVVYYVVSRIGLGCIHC